MSPHVLASSLKGSTDRTVRAVIPNYNYARFLPGCVRTILNQQGVDVQVLIIDDASQDESRQVAAALAIRDSRVEVRYHAANHGHIQTFNEGLEWAVNVPYVLVLSPDDGLTPGALQRACDLFEAHPEVGFVYGLAKVFRGDGPLPEISSKPAQFKTYRGVDWFATRCQEGYNCIYSPEVVMRSKILLTAGAKYLEDLPHTADFELWMRLALHGDVGVVDGPYQACYRDHDLGMHRAQFGDVLASMPQEKKAIDILFEQQADKIPDREHLRKIASERLAARTLWEACQALDRGDNGQAAALQHLATDLCGDIRGLREYHDLLKRKVRPAVRKLQSEPPD